MPPVMPAAKFLPVSLDHDHQAFGHVFAAVIADAFHHRRGAGIAHREAFARAAVEERFAGGRSVEHHVADQDILLRQEGGIARRIDDDLAAGQALAHVIVGVAFQFQRDARRQKRSEALPGRAGEAEVNRLRAPDPSIRACARSRPESIAPTVRSTLRIGSMNSTGVPFSMRRLGVVDQLGVQRLFQAVILRDGAAPADARRARPD